MNQKAHYSPIETQHDLQKWVEEHTNALYRRAYAKTGDQTLSEDLVQDTFLAAASAMDTFRGESQPLTWLYSILHRKIADHFRRVYKEKEAQIQNQSSKFDTHFFNTDGHWVMSNAPSTWASNDSLLDNEDFLSTLNKCLEKLPETWKSAVHLKYLDEKKSEHICQELQITTTNYWQMIHRAKLQLRECLELNWFK